MQRSTRDHPFVIKTDQGTDTFLHTSIGDDLVARLLSVRCLEAHLEALPSQDYACVVSTRKGTSLCFCVCDGVGSSSNGDLAARHLAIGLVGWLQALPDLEDTPHILSITLRVHLEQWAQEAQSELQGLDIPTETSAWVREIIEEGRDTRGSETVFLGGRIDYEQESDSRFSPYQLRTFFCWMGNVTARLFTAEDEYITLGDQDNDTNRWSTVRGRCGAPTLVSLPLNTIERLIIYTDGLDTIGDELAYLTDEELLARTQRMRQLPKNDDMTVLDLRWLHTPRAEEDAL